MVWIGSLSQGQFILKNATGNIEGPNKAVKILYDKAVDTFSITLQDGTRLIFDKSDNAPSYAASHSFRRDDQDSRDYCEQELRISMYESTPQQWHLTKVLFSDYADGNGDNEPDDAFKGQNIGSWIRLNYQENTALQQCFVSNTPKSQLIDDNGKWIWSGRFVTAFDASGKFNSTAENVKIHYLAEITTPNEKAVFNYSFDRLDNLWKRYDTKVTVMPEVLRNIQFVNKDGTVRKTVEFHTGYQLRPGTIGAYQNDETSMAGNLLGKSLTLESVLIKDRDGNSEPPISFWYDENRNYNAFPVTYDIPQGNTAYALRKDVWGYYIPDHTNQNYYGTQSGAQDVVGTPYGAAWSLRKVTYPNGASIEWEYEANRFDKTNNVDVWSSGTSPRYGGGIRVKKVISDDGLKTARSSISVSYFYTAIAGSFVELPNASNPTAASNSSGHATIEPMPRTYDLCDENSINCFDRLNNPNKPSDPRLDARTRGGLYSPTKVAYEMVQTVQNWNASQPTTAPMGYTVCQYYHSGDPNCPNLGVFGQIDNSWRRGFPKSIAQYSSTGKLIAKQEKTYDFIPGPELFPLVEMDRNNTNNAFERLKPLKDNLKTRDNFRTGSVRIKNEKIFKDGVWSEKKYEYADQQTQPSSADLSSADRIKENSRMLKGILFSDQSTGDYPVVCSVPPSNYFLIKKGSSALCTDIGDKTLKDMAIATKWQLQCGIEFYDEIAINIVQDMSFPDNSTPSGTWWNTFYFQRSTSRNTNNKDVFSLLGVGLWDIDNNGSPDLLIAWRNKEIDDVDFCRLTIYKGIYKALDGSFAYTSQCETSFQANPPPSIRYPWAWSNCTFGKIDNNSQLDVVFTNTDPSKEAPPLVGLNIGSNGAISSMCWIGSVVNGTVFYPPSTNNQLIDYDRDGKKNDLIFMTKSNFPNFTGPKVSPALNSTLTKVVYRNVSIGTGNVILLGENATVSNPIGTQASVPENTSLSVFFKWTDKLDQPVEDPNYFVDVAYADNFEEYYAFKDDKSLCVGLYKQEATRDYNGVPNIVRTNNSDNSEIVIKSIPAFAKYPTLITSNLLGGNCQTTMYGKKAGTVQEYFVLSSQATTLSNTLGCSRWLPNQTYTWKSSLKTDGTPVLVYSDFNFTAGATNANWILTGSIDKYSATGYPLQSSNAAGLSSTIIYDNYGDMPLALVTNATFYESGVFTCDYDQNNGIYFDYSNGWEHGIGNSANSSPSTSVIDATVKHFGDATVHVVNAFGPTRNVKIEKDNAGNIKNYELSAWVKPAAGVNLQKNVVIGIDYRRQIGTGWPVNLVPATTQAPIACSGTLTVKGNGPWYFISLTVPASTDLANQTWNPGWYARLWVGVPNGGEIWIDDIRFAPKNAMVTSTYYDAKWRQPILSVDANNNPSQQVVYDNWGRPTEWYKINPNTLARTIRQKKEYHLMGE